jgi:hypothetical protein
VLGVVQFGYLLTIVFSQVFLTAHWYILVFITIVILMHRDHQGFGHHSQYSLIDWVITWLISTSLALLHTFFYIILQSTIYLLFTCYWLLSLILNFLSKCNNFCLYFDIY